MSPRPKSFSAKPVEARAAQKWWVVDASGQPLGRLASRIATVLRGKHRPTFTPHVDTGDFVVVVNADKIKLTGDKLNQKMFSRHSGIPGGYKETPYGKLIAQKPELPIEKAVKGMLPKNILSRSLITKLKIYAGPAHPHASQQPEPLTF